MRGHVSEGHVLAYRGRAMLQSDGTGRPCEWEKEDTPCGGDERRFVGERTKGIFPSQMPYSCTLVTGA